LASYGPSALIEGIGLRKKPRQLIIAFLIGTCIYILSALPPPRLQTESVTSGLFNQANYYLAHGNFQNAISLYNQVLNKSGSFPDANLNLGAAYLKLGKSDSAKYYFHKEIDLYPERASAYINIASIEQINQSPSAAIEYADRAIHLKPYVVDGYIIKMRALAAMNDTTSLYNTIKDARKNTRLNPRIDLEAGIIYSNFGQYDKAIGFLNSALTAETSAVETDDRSFTYEDLTGPQLSNRIKSQAAYQLGYILGLRDRLTESIQKSALAISYDSSLAEAYVNLINGYRLAGKIDSALIVLSIALNKFPKNAAIHEIHKYLLK